MILDFALPALAMGAAASLALWLAPNAPPRLQLIIAALGIAAWFVPWPLVSFSLTSIDAPAATGWLGHSSVQLASMRYELGATRVPGASISVIEAWWPLLFVPGLIWFSLDCLAHVRRVRAWRRSSVDGAVLRELLPPSLKSFAGDVRIVAASAVAAATGLLRSTVWIGDRLDREGTLRAALVHESCHIRRRDPWRLLALKLAERLYWWNPLVLALAKRATLAVEAACDDDCADYIGRDAYRRTLAHYILDSQRREATELAAMLRSVSTNLRRLELLEEPRRMSLKACAAGVIFATGAVAGIAFAAQPADPRIGSWMEVTDSVPGSPMLRVFEDRGRGLTRVSSYVAEYGMATPMSWSEHRCDGRTYPAFGAAGADANWSVLCRNVGVSAVAFTFTALDGSGRRAVGTDTVSSDGRTYTLSVTTYSDSGTVLETDERTFWRLD